MTQEQLGHRVSAAVNAGGEAIGTSANGPLTAQLITLGNLLRRSATLRYMRVLGLGLLEWRVIARIDGRRSSSLTAIAEEIGLDKAQMSRGVAALVERGLVLRDVNPRNRREVRLLLTARGRAVRRRIEAVARARGADITAGLSDSQRVEFERTLGHVLERARALLAREQEAGTR